MVTVSVLERSGWFGPWLLLREWITAVASNGCVMAFSCRCVLVSGALIIFMGAIDFNDFEYRWQYNNQGSEYKTHGCHLPWGTKKTAPRGAACGV